MVLRFHLSFLCSCISAVIAEPVVNADAGSAFGTSPFDLFVCQEISQPKPLDVFQILDHAHAVARPVEFVQMFHSVTGKPFTLRTKTQLTCSKVPAFFEPASHPAGAMADIGASATGTLFCFSQIRHTKTAIHPAGRDELGFT